MSQVIPDIRKGLDSLYYFTKKINFFHLREPQNLEKIEFHLFIYFILFYFFFSFLQVFICQDNQLLGANAVN